MKKNKYSSSSPRNGFSILEVLIVLAIFTGVLFTAAGFRSNVDIIGNFITDRLQSRRDLSQTFQILVTEIRSANQSSLGAYSIESAATSSFTFFSDINKDNFSDRVRYFLNASGTTLQKGVIAPSGNPLQYATSSEIITTVAENILLNASSVVFQYYDSGYTGSEASMSLPISLAEIRVVEVTIPVDADDDSTTTSTIIFSDTITIRNLRSN